MPFSATWSEWTLANLRDVPRRILLVAVVALVAVSSCTSAEPPDPAEVETCEDMVDAATRLVEQYLEALEDQPLEVLTGEAPPSERIADLDAVSGGFDARIAELGCDPATVNAGVVANLEDVEVDHAAGRLLLDLVRNGFNVVEPVPDTEPGG